MMGMEAFRAELAAAKEVSERPNEDATPYKTKYEAREMLKALRARLAAELESAGTSTSDRQELQERVAIVDEKLGLNFIECEENSEGERHLKGAIEVLRTNHCLSRYLSIVQEALNSVGILWASREDHKKAKASLLDSESLYTEHKGSTADDALEPPEQVEAQYTLTQYYLAQVHGHLGESEDAARCCATTLRRQLGPTGQCDHQEWATNCMHLSSYYVANADFGRAKHCLDAAARMMPDDAEQPAHADLDIAYGKFCLARLGWGAKDFREMIQREEEAGEDEEARAATVEQRDSADLNCPPEIEDTDGEGLDTMFEECGCEPVRQLESVRTFDDARAVFKAANPRYERASKYYVLDGFVSNHIAILQDQSELYRQLAIFERDGERKVKMHRRRAAYLETLPTVLNPTAFEQLYKDVTHELGQIYSGILEIKLAMAENGEKSLSDKKKLELVEKSVRHFDLFVGSFRWLYGTASTDADKEEQRRSIKESEESGVMEWFLSAQFLKARLLGKIETVPFQMRSCEMYRWLVEFAENKLPAGSEAFRGEFEIAKQMLELLPTKIERM